MTVANPYLKKKSLPTVASVRSSVVKSAIATKVPERNSGGGGSNSGNRSHNGTPSVDRSRQPPYQKSQTSIQSKNNTMPLKEARNVQRSPSAIVSPKSNKNPYTHSRKTVTPTPKKMHTNNPSRILPNSHFTSNNVASPAAVNNSSESGKLIKAPPSHGTGVRHSHNITKAGHVAKKIDAVKKDLAHVSSARPPSNAARTVPITNLKTSTKINGIAVNNNKCNNSQQIPPSKTPPPKEKTAPSTINKPTTTIATPRNPLSLKAQLKAQIQQLHRQKKQHLLLKEKQKLEAQRQQQKLEREEELKRLQLQKEKEREEKRKVKEEERLRKEEERRKREEERRIKHEEVQTRMREDQVRRVMMNMVSTVERRVWLEDRTGVEYGISEAMSFMVGEVEQRVGKEMLENRNYMMSQWQQHQRLITPQAVGSAYLNAPGWHTGQSAYHPSTYPNPTALQYHHPVGVLPYSSMHPPHSSKPYYYVPPPQVSLPTSKPNKPTTAMASKPLILHNNPIADPFSPFRHSHHIFEKKICVTKQSVKDSFGVVLRFESKSALVPRELDVIESKQTSIVGGNVSSNSGMKICSNVEGNANTPLVGDAVKTPNQVGIVSINDLSGAQASGAKDIKDGVVKEEVSSSPTESAPSLATIPTAKISMGISNNTATSTPVALVQASEKPNESTAQLFGTAIVQKPKRKRRRRVNFGVLSVVDTKNARFGIISGESGNEVTMDQEAQVPTLQRGDIIISVNGKNVGGMTFAEACRVIATTSKQHGVVSKHARLNNLSEDKNYDGESSSPQTIESRGENKSEDGVICCVLVVARQIHNYLGNKHLVMPSAVTSSNATTIAPAPGIVLSGASNGESIVPTKSAKVHQLSPTITEVKTDSGTNFLNVSVTTPPEPSCPLSTIIPTPIVPLIPFISSGGKVSSGEFTSVEWQSLVYGLLNISRQLTSGMALLPVALKDILAALKTNDDYGKYLKQRGIDALVAKLSHEGRRIESEMKKRAVEYWTAKWKLEVEKDAQNKNNALFDKFLTDARRSILRSVARPFQGCKCGSSTHEFVNDPQCVLYRDVKMFLSIDRATPGSRKSQGLLASSKNKKARNSLEAAYIDRFVKLRAETEATKEEAGYVLQMEKKQASEMNMAVFAPSTLCVMVLSAVASLTENLGDTELDNQETMREELSDGTDCLKKDKSNCCGVNESQESSRIDDDDDGDDIPLTSLISSKGLKRTTTSSSGVSPSKRPKQSIASSIKEVPGIYFLAEILQHISKTFGHLFVEPSHAEFAW